MFTVVITEKGGAQKRLAFAEPEVTIGRVPGNDIVLPKGNVSKRHSRIVLKDSRFIVVDLKSTNGTYVNGRKITSPLVVKEGDKIYIGDYIMTLEGDAAQAAPSEAMRQPSVLPPPGEGATSANGAAGSSPPPLPPRAPEPLADDGIPAVLRSASLSSVGPDPSSAAPSEGFLSQPAMGATASSFAPGGAPPSVPPVLAAEAEPAVLSERTQASVPSPEVTPFTPHPGLAVAELTGRRSVGPASASRPDASLTPSRGAVSRPAGSGPPRGAQQTSSIPPATRDELRALMYRVGRDVDTDNADPGGLLDERRWANAERAIQNKLGELSHEGAIGRGTDTAILANAALHEAVGLGPLDSLLADEGVRHVTVERFDRVRVNRGDGLKLEETGFSSPQALLIAARRLLAQAGVSERGEATFDVSLPNGLHVVCALPAAATEGPLLSLRRRPCKAIALAELQRDGRLSAEQAKSLTAALAAQTNVLFVGSRADDLAVLMASALDTCRAEERLAVFELAPELALGERSAICVKRGVASLAELASRVRHFRPDRCVIHDLARAELTTAVTTVLAQGDGSLVSMERGDPRDALSELAGAARELGPHGLDQVSRAIQLVVSVVHERSGARVAGLHRLQIAADALTLAEL